MTELHKMACPEQEERRGKEARKMERERERESENEGLERKEEEEEEEEKADFGGKIHPGSRARSSIAVFINLRIHQPWSSSILASINPSSSFRPQNLAVVPQRHLVGKTEQ